MFYTVRCSSGACRPVFFFRLALLCLKSAGPDAGIYSFTGKFVAGRCPVGT